MYVRVTWIYVVYVWCVGVWCIMECDSVSCVSRVSVNTWCMCGVHLYVRGVYTIMCIWCGVREHTVYKRMVW